MAKNYLDKTGLSYFYNKIKSKIESKQNKVLSGTGKPTDDLGNDGDVYLEIIDNINLVTGGDAIKTGNIIDGKEEYVKRFKFTSLNVNGTNTHLTSLGFDISQHIITDIRGTFYTNVGNYFGINSGINTQSTYDYLVNCTSNSELKITTYNQNFSEAYINVYYIAK